MHCILDNSKICDDCGECHFCDLDPDKICDNCCKCIQQDDADKIEIPLNKLYKAMEQQTVPENDEFIDVDILKKCNFKSPIRMKGWVRVHDNTDEIYTLKKYSYIVGGFFDNKCNFHYTVYIKDKYDFNFVEDSHGSYLHLDNLFRFGGGTIPRFFFNAKAFIVKGKKEGIFYAKDL